MEISQIPRTLNIEDDWSGYAINHTRDPDDENYRDPDYFPETDDYRFVSAGASLVVAPVYSKFLLVAKVLFLARDPDDSEPLKEYIPLVLETYDYGTWSNNLPEKQDKIARFFVGNYSEELGSTTLSLGTRSRYIPRAKTVQDLEEIVARKRTAAISFLKAQAKASGDQSSVDAFFEIFALDEIGYIQTGNDNLINSLNLSSEPWLDEPFNDEDPRSRKDLIIFYLREGQTIPTEQEISEVILGSYNPNPVITETER